MCDYVIALSYLRVNVCILSCVHACLLNCLITEKKIHLSVGRDQLCLQILRKLSNYYFFACEEKKYNPRKIFNLTCTIKQLENKFNNLQAQNLAPTCIKQSISIHFNGMFFLFVFFFTAVADHGAAQKFEILTLMDSSQSHRLHWKVVASSSSHLLLPCRTPGKDEKFLETVHCNFSSTICKYRKELLDHAGNPVNHRSFHFHLISNHTAIHFQIKRFILFIQTPS